MEMIDVIYFTDPLCPWSWAAEPALLRVEAEFGDQVRIRYVMVGMARVLDAEHELRELLEAVGASGMPADPRVWMDSPPRSSHPACLAVNAAAEQRLDGPYLRRLRRALRDRHALQRDRRGVRRRSRRRRRRRGHPRRHPGVCGRRRRAARNPSHPPR